MSASKCEYLCRKHNKHEILTKKETIGAQNVRIPIGNIKKNIPASTPNKTVWHHCGKQHALERRLAASRRGSGRGSGDRGPMERILGTRQEPHVGTYLGKKKTNSHHSEPGKLTGLKII